MKVILLSNVPNLGKIDEIKEVSDGYAHNYLFAKNLAIPASKKAMSDMEVKENKKKKKSEHELQQQQSIASKIDGYEIEIMEKVSKEGSLYAGVSAGAVASELKKKGFNISKKQIKMKT